MLDISIKWDNFHEITDLNMDVRIADQAAIREVASTLLIPALHAAFSFSGGNAPVGRLGVVSGRTRAQIKLKLFRSKDGLTNGSVKVIGDRAHIARFNEDGTKYVPARKMFETVGASLRPALEAALVAAFDKNMKALGH